MNIDRAYPKCKYHRTGKTTIVKDVDAEAALGEGWGDSPGGPSGLQDDADPFQRFDTWGLECLRSDARGRIRTGMANAHAGVIESGPDPDSRVRQASMRKVFGIFAEEYLRAGLLTESMMDDSIPRMVYDAAVSGGWQTGSLARNGGCTLQFGHYWVPPDVPKMLTKLLQGEVWRWRGELEATPGSFEPRTSRTSGLKRMQPPAALASPKVDSPEHGHRQDDKLVAERAARRGPQVPGGAGQRVQPSTIQRPR